MVKIAPAGNNLRAAAEDCGTTGSRFPKAWRRAGLAERSHLVLRERIAYAPRALREAIMIFRNLHCAIIIGTALAAASANAAVEISAGPTANMTCSAGVCTPTAKQAVLNVSDLASMLASGDATIRTTSQAQDIEIDAKLSWATRHLTLDSYRSIFFNKPFEINRAGALTITTNDGGVDGDFRFFGKGRVEFRDITSNLTVNGQRYVLAKSVSQIRKLIHRGRGADYIALANDIDATDYTSGTMPFGPGILEGLGNTISNLKFGSAIDSANVGLFNEIGGVRDIGFLNVNILGFGNSQRVGAIAGVVDGYILNSFVTGSVSGTGSNSQTGALAGVNTGTVAFCHSNASVTVGPLGVSAGGLVGTNAAGNQGQWNGVIENSYSTGNVTGGDNIKTGGVVGYNFGGAIRNSYATGSVVGGNNSFVGGLTGANANSDSSSPTISSSYSIGAVTGGSGATIGGLIGEDLAGTGTTNSYWDMDASGITNPANGAGNVQNDPGITGLSDTQLKSGLPAGFDPSVWAEKSKLNGGYPYLIGNPPPK
jgi:The GLUG motif